MSGRIYVVATPLGNAEDLSPRARRILAEVDFIACEDTRKTGLLLHGLGIQGKTLVSYFDAKELEKSFEIIERISKSGESCALVSDAGTPAIADPGYRLLKLAHEKKIEVHSVPGPSALSTLVSVSGLPSDQFLFVGFLPRKTKELETALDLWKQLRVSVVAFESPKRFQKSLEFLSLHVPNACISIGREMTKLYEEIVQLRILEALSWAKEHSHLKGELALMIDFRIEDSPKSSDELLIPKAKFLLEKGLSTKDVVEFFSEDLADKKDFYKRVSELKKSV